MSSQETRRERVRSLLAGSGNAMTVPELASTIGCSEVSIRRSLRDLADEGLVIEAGILPRYGAAGKLLWGRGRTLYAAATRSLPRAG